jgi:hypothetical protein
VLPVSPLPLRCKRQLGRRGSRGAPTLIPRGREFVIGVIAAAAVAVNRDVEAAVEPS